MHGPPTSDMMYRRPASTSTPVSAAQNPSNLRCAVANPDTTYPLPATDAPPAHQLPPPSRDSESSNFPLRPTNASIPPSSPIGLPHRTDGAPRTHHFPLFIAFMLPIESRSRERGYISRPCPPSSRHHGATPASATPRRAHHHAINAPPRSTFKFWISRSREPSYGFPGAARRSRAITASSRRRSPPRSLNSAFRAPASNVTSRVRTITPPPSTI
ncbi:hypothetical protein DFH09DRAFT_1398630 [Mycena vulgaris]|nr:hypothetical protein DFH09DRAFT_1398630 [Mycena vulgaris]